MRRRMGLSLLIIPLVVVAGLLLIPLSASLVGQSVEPDTRLAGSLDFLLAPPAFAQTQTVTPFPDDQAGISAYIRLSGASTTLDNLVTQLFTSMTHAGDNYVIGQFTQSRSLFSNVHRNSVEVWLYADSEGWLVAYMPRDRLSSEILYSKANESWKSVLAKALDRADKVAGSSTQDIDQANVGYYHWAFPQAAHLAVALRTAPGNLYFGIPATTTTQNVEVHDLSAATSCWYSGGSTSQPAVELNGNLLYSCVVQSSSGSTYVTVPLITGLPSGQGVRNDGVKVYEIQLPTFVRSTPLTLGPVHTLTWSTGGGGLFAGIAIVYRVQ